MPTITFSLQDLNKLVGRKLTIKQVENLVEDGKGELKDYNKKLDEASVNFDDTNLPYLWSAEGIARLIKGVLGKQKGIPKFKVKEGKYKVIVDKNVKNIRPYIAAFVAKGHKIDDYLIRQMIQLQEKFCESYGRRREKVAIGVYSYEKIKFPVHYKATDPESIEFIPLEYKRKMTQQEILEEHPKGKEYAWIFEGFKKYPILVDHKNDVLSFPPIINSNWSGKIEPGDKDLLVEVTGTDEDSTNLAANIFAQALFDRGFEIYQTEIQYPDKKITCPYIFNDKLKITQQQTRELLGLNLTEPQIKNLLQKAQYNYEAKGKDLIVHIPFYRKDIMHPYDVIEDIAIAYGYQKIKPEPMKSYTTGETFEINQFIDLARETLIGLGYQETMSPILSNKDALYTKMNMKELETIEIKEFMSERYSVVRTWLLPILMEVLSKNKHAEYPQKIFEEGMLTTRKKDYIKDIHRIAMVTCHTNANYTEARQAFDFLMMVLGITDYTIKEAEHPSFIPGRVARVYVKDQAVAYIGEIAPQVLTNWDITMPAAGFELNLTDLFEIIK